MYTHSRPEKQKKKKKKHMYEQDILQERGKLLNRGTLEHLTIYHVLILMVIHYNESYLWTQKGYVNTYLKFQRSGSTVKTIFFEKILHDISNPCIIS